MYPWPHCHDQTSVIPILTLELKIHEIIKNMYNDQLPKALGLYFIILILTFLFAVFFLKIKLFHAFIFALIIAYIFLYFIFIPTKYNIFSEFNSANAIYITIQYFTLITVFIYALVCSLKKSNCPTS